jgi:hypothetical protein
VDENGDLTLRTPDEDFLVCSRAMRRASDAWKKMLFGSFREA